MAQRIYLINKNDEVVKVFTDLAKNITIGYVKNEESIDLYTPARLKSLKSKNINIVELGSVSLAELKESDFFINSNLFLSTEGKSRTHAQSPALTTVAEDRMKPFIKWSGISQVGLVLLFLIFSIFYANEPRVVKKEVQLYKTSIKKNKIKPKTLKVASNKKRGKKQFKSVKRKYKTKKQIAKRASKIKRHKSIGKVKLKTKVGNYSKGRTKKSKKVKKSSSGVLKAFSSAKATDFNVSRVGNKFNPVNTKKGSPGAQGKEFSSMGRHFSDSKGKRNSVQVGGYASGPKSNEKIGRINTDGNSTFIRTPSQREGSLGGGLAMSQVQAIIKKHQGELTYCYEKNLQTQPNLRGQVSVKFIINRSGRVSSAGIAHSSMRSPRVENCIARAFKRWKFPKPHEGVNVSVQYPIAFTRSNQG